jgi:hypothetical protein
LKIQNINSYYKPLFSSPSLLRFREASAKQSWGRDIGRGKKVQGGANTRVNLKLSLPKILYYEQSFMETRNDDLSVTGGNGKLRINS